LFTEEQVSVVVRRYLSGETCWKISYDFDVSDTTIAKLLDRNGIKRRSGQGGRSGPRGYSWSRRSKPSKLLSHEPEICRRYEAGENTVQLGKVFGVSSSTIRQILKRSGIERRAVGGICDTLQQALDCSHHFDQHRECQFYLCELARYSDTYCKPGIAFDIDGRRRLAKGEYGAEVLRLVFATRQEAFFLEQAVLDATRDLAKCPDDLLDWGGASEVRAMSADDMVPIIDQLAAELEEIGPWAFAAAYVPMTPAQRAVCHQR
jgi:transposase